MKKINAKNGRHPHSRFASPTVCAMSPPPTQCRFCRQSQRNDIVTSNQNLMPAFGVFRVHLNVLTRLLFSNCVAHVARPLHHHARCPRPSGIGISGFKEQFMQHHSTIRSSSKLAWHVFERGCCPSSRRQRRSVRLHRHHTSASRHIPPSAPN